MLRSFSFIGSLLLLLCSVSSFELKDNGGSRRDLLKAASTFASGAVVASSLFGVESASAYERRDVGGADRSAATAAMNEQAFKTNNRLEQSGFKLDTREEEQARLSSAMSSFSYDSATTKTKSGYKGSASSEKK